MEMSKAKATRLSSDLCDAEEAWANALYVVATTNGTRLAALGRCSTVVSDYLAREEGINSRQIDLADRTLEAVAFNRLVLGEED